MECLGRKGQGGATRLTFVCVQRSWYVAGTVPGVARRLRRTQANIWSSGEPSFPKLSLTRAQVASVCCVFCSNGSLAGDQKSIYVHIHKIRECAF